MSNKTYGQLCPLARALDVLGDRWMLLVVRELLLGPKRFKDLLAALPAMGTNRLSDRLASLVESGVAQQTTLVGVSATAYELTEFGEQLRSPVIGLALWGLCLPLDARIDASSARAELIALCLACASTPDRISGVRESYEFHVGQEVFHIQVDHGRALARSGASMTPPDVQVVCDLDTFMALALRQMTPAQALRQSGTQLLRGDRKAFAQVFKLLEYTPAPGLPVPV